MQLTVRDVARILDVPERTVQKWVTNEGLPAQRVAGQYHFNRAELFEWATIRKLAISSEIFSDGDCETTDPVDFSEALHRGGIQYAVGGADKARVLRSVLEGMVLPEGIHRDFLLQLFLTRESMGSTGVGDGIAIPHPRYPVVLPLLHPVATLCFLERSIDFAAHDQRPVDTLFVLLSPTVRTHLKLLTQLALALRDDSFRACVKRKASADEILSVAMRLSGAATDLARNGSLEAT